MRTTESVDFPCEKCGHNSIGTHDKFVTAMKLSPAQVELAQLVADEESVDFLGALDTWISSSFANRNSETEITHDEWHAMFYIYELQKLIREIHTEHCIEKGFLENYRPADWLPEDVWKVVETAEHMFDKLDPRTDKIPQRAYKQLMKAVAVVTQKYRA